MGGFYVRKKKECAAASEGREAGGGVPGLRLSEEAQRGEDTVEDGGDKSPGEAVVVEVQPTHRGAGTLDQTDVEKSGQNTERPAVAAGDGGEGGAEEDGELDGRIGEGEAR